MSASPSRRHGGRVALRPAEAADCERIWRWRNDEETRRASFDSSPIPYATHEHWFGAALTSERRKLYIVLAGGQDAGVVRLDLDGGRATVSIHLAPERRGQGVGPAALDAVAGLAFDQLAVDELVASVKQDNRASLSAFAKAGFATAQTGAVVTLRRSRERRAPDPPREEAAAIPSPPEGERARVRGT